jgi:hypothetical protein
MMEEDPRQKYRGRDKEKEKEGPEWKLRPRHHSNLNSYTRKPQSVLTPPHTTIREGEMQTFTAFLTIILFCIYRHIRRKSLQRNKGMMIAMTGIAIIQKLRFILWARGKGKGEGDVHDIRVVVVDRPHILEVHSLHENVFQGMIEGFGRGGTNEVASEEGEWEEDDGYCCQLAPVSRKWAVGRMKAWKMAYMTLFMS